MCTAVGLCFGWIIIFTSSLHPHARGFDPGGIRFEVFTSSPSGPTR